MSDFATWLGKTFRKNACFTQRPRLRRQPKSPLRLEQLEDRLVPTVVFEPHFGPETLHYGGGPVLGDTPVYLLYWGSYWKTSAGAASETQLTNAINNELKSPIYSRLGSNYGAGPVYLWGTQNGGNPVTWNADETGDPSSGFTDARMQNVVTSAINDPNSPILAPTAIESQDGGHAPIYFVIMPPSITYYYPGYFAYHSDTYANLYNGNNQNVLYGWSSNGLDPYYNTQDFITQAVSHELGEAITDPEVGTGHYGYQTYSGANWPFGSQLDEIGDFEPSPQPTATPGYYAGYTYRLNGSLTQALWDQADQAFTVSDGTSQNFYIYPQYQHNAQTGKYDYIGNELCIQGDQYGYGSNDSVTVYTASNGGVAVDLNGEIVTFDPGQITSLDIATGGGTNNISVLSTPKGMTTSIDCEGNGDNVTIGNDVGQEGYGFGLMSGIKGSVGIGGGGAYNLKVDDSGDRTGQSVSIANIGSGNGQIVVGGAAAVSCYGACAGLHVYGGNYSNTFNVSNTPDAPTFLGTGTGNDTVKVSATTGSLTLYNPGGHDSDFVGLGKTGNINGSVNVNGSGTTALVVDDHLDTAADNATVTGGMVAGMGMTGTGVISYDSSVTSLTLIGSNSAGLYSIQDTNTGTAYTVNGGAGNDTFIIGTGLLFELGGGVTVNGKGGSDQLIVNDDKIANTESYTISSTTVSSPGFAGLTYGGVHTVYLAGAMGGSVYNVNSTAAGTTYTISAGVGNDTFNIGTGNLNSLVGAVSVNGGGGSNTVTVNDQSNPSTDAYTITSSTVSRPLFGGLTYGSVQSLTLNGESGGNVYHVNSTADSTTYTLNGGAGANTLAGPNSASSTTTLTGFAAAGIGPGETNNIYVGFSSANVTGVSITKITFDTTAENVYLNPYGSGAGSINNGVGSFTSFPAEPPIFLPETVSVFGVNTSGFGVGASLFDANLNLQTLSGNMALPANLQGAKVTVNFSDGLTATTTLTTALQGSNALGSYDDVEGLFTASSTTTIPVGWSLTSANAGSMGNVKFNHFGNLTGGAGSDSFNFGAAGSVSGAINGGGGMNTLNYAGHSTSVTVNEQTHTATATGGFSNITALVGGSGSTTLVGPNAVNTWNLTGANAGNLNGSLTFTGIGNLTGGTAMDVFKFSNGASVSGGLNGGGGGDWLDYAAYTSAITVNLAANTASHTGGISNIQNVRAGSGGSTLTGNALGNILVGGTGVDNIQGGSGRSVLIGASGADSVKGGSGDDIVIGGTTSYNANDLALMSILAEWQSANSYALRVSHLKLGGGLNGTNKLAFGTTVLDDGASNHLTGGAGMDWFFKGAHDTIADLQAGEEVN